MIKKNRDKLEFIFFLRRESDTKRKEKLGKNNLNFAECFGNSMMPEAREAFSVSILFKFYKSKEAKIVCFSLIVRKSKYQIYRKFPRKLNSSKVFHENAFKHE